MYHPLTTPDQRGELWAMIIATLGTKHAERAQAVLQDLRDAEAHIRVSDAQSTPPLKPGDEVWVKATVLPCLHPKTGYIRVNIDDRFYFFVPVDLIKSTRREEERRCTIK